MRLSESSFQEIKALINQALSEFRRPSDQAVVTDIHIMPIRETGDVTVSDDDRDLATTRLSDLVDIPEEDFYQVSSRISTRCSRWIPWPYGNPSRLFLWTMTARPWPSLCSLTMTTPS